MSSPAGSQHGRHQAIRRLAAGGAIVTMAFIWVVPTNASEVASREPPLAAPLSDCVSSDNGDPTLVSFRISPSAIDVSGRSKEVRFLVRAKDTGGPGPSTGVHHVSVLFGHLPGDESFGWRRVRLTLSNTGAWVGSSIVRRGSDPGTIPVGGIDLGDEARNHTSIGPRELATSGFPTGVAVTSKPDHTPPRLTSLSFPHLVDSRRSDTTVTFKASAVDAESGVGGIWLYFSGAAFLGEAPGIGLDRVHGTAHQLRGRLEIAQWSGSGTATIYGLRLANRLGDFRFYSGRDLDRLGFERTLTFKSRTERRRPVVSLFARSPSDVDVRNRDRRVTFTVRASDAGSGVRSVYVSSGWRDYVTLHLISGTSAKGVWRGSLLVERCASTSGARDVGVYVSDRASAYGNVVQYGPNALEARGWPSGFGVTAGDHDEPRVRLAHSTINRTDPIRLTFSETVSGIADDSVIVRRVVVGRAWPPRFGRTLHGTWACTDESQTAVDCTTGDVRHATFTPATSLLASRSYSVMLNPEHVLKVTDLAGNPFKRAERQLHVRR